MHSLFMQITKTDLDKLKTFVFIYYVFRSKVEVALNCLIGANEATVMHFFQYSVTQWFKLFFKVILAVTRVHD